MSRWLDRLGELRSGVATPLADTEPPRSKCSNVQNEGSFEQLNILNSGAAPARAARAPSEALLDAADLRDRYDERAAIRQFDGGYSKEQAERLAWGEVAGIWYRQHGQRVPDHLCAGCGALISGRTVLLLPHGERAHSDDNSRCIIAYGKRWKTAAAAALVGIGISTPTGALMIETVIEPATIGKERQ